MTDDRADLLARSEAVLDESWLPAQGFCPPNQNVYPHQWLWDSCFHAIAWSALGDERALTELTTCFAAQLPSGFVPHMRYLEPNTDRGPNANRSSYTQPPIYAHTAAVIARSGRTIPEPLLDKIEAGLTWLWQHRMTADGLLYIVHPWESGADDSPRWDSWVNITPYDRQQYRTVDVRLREQTVYDDDNVATWSKEFVAAPAAYNAFAAHAAFELAELRHDEAWSARGATLAAAMDEALWDDDEALWRDRAIVGDASTSSIPTLDGAFGALVTADPAHARRALDQLLDARRFAAPYGLAYLPPSHPRFDADEYWRGPAWPQLNYMAYVAANRNNRADVATAIAEMSTAGGRASDLAEFWNPLTGAGRGAIPQGWGALAAVFVLDA